MHPNPIFRKSEDLQNIEFARQHGFGILALNHKAQSAPLVSHIPFLLNETGTCLEAHLVKSNPIYQNITGDQEAVMIINGPDSYISPDWYKLDDQVPTWNYIAVHLRGKITILPDQKLLPILDRLSDKFEHQLSPKPAWKSSKMDKLALAKMLRMIAPIAMDITQIDGTWKLSQNKTSDARLNAAQEVKKHGFGTQASKLAELMKQPTC